MEIYNEEIRDLLTPDVIKRKLEIKESKEGVHVQDCQVRVCSSVQELMRCLHEGNKNRATGETLMNRDSSRSHCIFTIYVETAQNKPQNGNHLIATTNDSEQSVIRLGKLNLVDLAGSEKQKKTNSTGIRFREATKINLSLSALMNVITSLCNGKQ